MMMRGEKFTSFLNESGLEKKVDRMSQPENTEFVGGNRSVELLSEKAEKLSTEDKVLELYDLWMSLRRARIQERKEDKQTGEVIGEEFDFSADDDVAFLREMFGNADTVTQQAFERLWGDEETRKLFLEKYRQFREEVMVVKRTDIYRKANKFEKEVDKIDDILEKVTRVLVQRKYHGEKERVGYEQIAGGTGEKIKNLLAGRRELLEEVEAKDIPMSADTDVLAFLAYEEIKKYHDQGKDGFVKLPSRAEVHREILRRLANKRMPVLVGETGSGKSEQVMAAAKEIAGYEALTVQCSENTTEYDLIGVQEVDENGESYIKYGPVMQAITGYADSRQDTPAVKVGRICRFDEFNLLGDAPYAIIKRLGQLKPGDDFYGKPVLPGAGVILTMNPVGPRYESGRREIDAAASREYGFIEVPYLEMSEENPEIYKFMLQALMSDNGLVSVDARECMPYYRPGERPDDGGDEIEIDGKKYRVIAGPEKSDQDPTALDDEGRARHGALWRLSYALRDIQNAFVNGNLPDDNLADPNSPRFIEVDGEIQITKDGSGNLLTLDSGIITAGDIASWLNNFQERSKNKDVALRADTLAGWIKLELEGHLKSLVAENKINHADATAIRAVFNHYHLLDEGKFQELDGTKQIAGHLEIGYWSPDTPRPAQLELIKNNSSDEKSDKADQKRIAAEAQEFETEKMTLIDGIFVDIFKRPIVRENDEGGDEEILSLGQIKAIPIYTTEGMRTQRARFEGVVSDGELAGKPVFSLASEDYEMCVVIDTAEPEDWEVFEQVVSVAGRSDVIMKTLDQVEERVCNSNNSTNGGKLSGGADSN